MIPLSFSFITLYESISWIHYESTICFANSLWFHYLFLLSNRMYRLLHVGLRQDESFNRIQKVLNEESLRHSRTDSYAMSNGLLVMIWKYFTFSKKDFLIFEHDLAALFYLRRGVINTWIDSSQPFLVPWLVKSLKNSQKGFWVWT